MDSTPPSKTDPINVVGAGIFGLSTALHLARRGYTNVTLFDRQPYEKTLYSYFNGCDAASADINKILRSAYGSQTEYQDLSTEAIAEWKAWNAELEAGGSNLPPGMKTSDRVFDQCGSLQCGDGNVLPPFERLTVENMEKAGHKGTQLINNDPEHKKLAEQKALSHAMQPFAKSVLGVLDSTGGLVVADKACRLALHKAIRLGVKLCLDPKAGRFESFLQSSSSQVTGVKTADGKEHPAAMTIMACGGWTPSLLPSLDYLCETTAGSVIVMKIPESSPLRQRFDSSRFPTYLFKMRDGAEGGIYGFPVDNNGYLKIGYRGTKYTNPKTQSDGTQRSVPVTRWTSGAEGTLTQIPEQAVRVMQRFIDEYLPELKDIGIYKSRVCWYTDSYDNHFVIDRVPAQKGVMCATAGSGHAFKYLPNIGNWVVDVMEGVGMDRALMKRWKWRSLGKNETPVNVLMAGETGERALQNIPLVTAESPVARL